MKARLIAKAKEVRDNGDIVEIVIWQVPVPVAPCHHDCKYRLFFGQPGREVVRLDNERGKGDHCHTPDGESVYRFESLDQLLADFQKLVELWS